MNTRKRPTTVTAISWLMIIGGGLSVFSVLLVLNNSGSQQILNALGASTSVVALINAFSSGTNIASGIAMLRGRNWGRRLFIVVTPVLLLISMALYNFAFALTSFIGAIWYAVAVAFLTRRPVSDYFAGSAEAGSPPSEVMAKPPVRQSTTGKKVASVILLVLGGFLLIACFMGLLLIPSGNFLTLVVVAGTYGALACAFIVPGVFLWGRKRWAAVLGTLVATIGGGLLLSSLMLVEFTSIPEFGDQFASVGSDMIPGFLLIGIPATLMGGLLILLQRRSDSKTKLPA